MSVVIIESGYVYAIGYEGCVKLGISATDASGRLRTMQTGNVAELSLIAQAYVANYKLIEKALHREHKNRWIRGEWYSLSVEEARSIISSVGEDLVERENAFRQQKANQEYIRLENQMNRITHRGEFCSICKARAGYCDCNSAEVSA